jgi:hypothetical protein
MVRLSQPQRFRDGIAKSPAGQRLAQYLERQRSERGLELHRMPPEADAYRGLSHFSLRFDRVEIGARSPAVNVLVPGVRPGQIFAGVRTALAFGHMLSVELDRRLRVASISRGGTSRRAGAASELRAAIGIDDLSLTRLGDGDTLYAGHDDVWVVTHWTTAHAVDIASRVGIVDPANVVYLVQDYEPGFHPWSTDFVLARATYHAGFQLVVNSKPLADYLGRQELIDVRPDAIFAPHLDLDRLARIASERIRGERVGVFFYARPSKPRNLYQLGVAALRRAHRLLGSDAARCNVFAAGERCPRIRLAPGCTAQALGETGWDGYLELLRTVHVGLSLMHSPHPSHPPLELAISGARAVTNTFADARDGLHPRITTAPADPDELARALVDAVGAALEDPCGPFEPLMHGALGAPLPDVTRWVASRLV